MDVLNILKSVGIGVLKTVVPAAGFLIDEVNEALTGDDKLGDNATGQDVRNAIKKLSPDLQAQILSKHIDVDIEQIQQSNETLRAALIADATNPQSTRPKAVMTLVWFVCIITTIFALSLIYAVLRENTALVDAISAIWMVVAVAIAPFFIPINAYFGIIRDENRDKLNASSGLPAGKTGIIGALAGKLLGGKQ